MTLPSAISYPVNVLFRWRWTQDGSGHSAQRIEAAEGCGLFVGVASAVAAVGLETQQAWGEQAEAQRDLADVGDGLATLQLGELAAKGLGDTDATSLAADHARQALADRRAAQHLIEGRINVALRQC